MIWQNDHFKTVSENFSRTLTAFILLKILMIDSISFKLVLINSAGKNFGVEI